MQVTRKAPGEEAREQERKESELPKEFLVFGYRLKQTGSSHDKESFSAAYASADGTKKLHVKFASEFDTYFLGDYKHGQITYSDSANAVEVSFNGIQSRRGGWELEFTGAKAEGLEFARSNGHVVMRVPASGNGKAGLPEISGTLAGRIRAATDASEGSIYRVALTPVFSEFANSCDRPA